MLKIFRELRTVDSENHANRIHYAWGEACYLTADQLSTGVYLVSLLLYFGFSDGTIGIIQAIVSLAAFVQLLTLPFPVFRQRKRMVTIITSFMRVIMAGLYLIPLLPIPQPWGGVLLVVGFFVMKGFVAIGTPAASAWIAELAPAEILGRFLSMKQSVSMFLMSIVMLGAGYILDIYTGEQALTAFCWLGGITAVLCVWGLMELMKVGPGRSDIRTVSRHWGSDGFFRQIVRSFRQKNFRKLLLIDSLWAAIMYISLPFNSGYSVKQLEISAIFISACTFGGNFLRIFLGYQMGRWGDRLGMSRILRYAVGLFGLHFVVWAAMVPQNAIPMYILMQLLSTAGSSFTTVGIFAVKVKLMPEKDRATQFALSAAFSGALGFLISYIAGVALSAMERLSIVVLGMEIYPQQILNVCAVVFCILLVWYLKTMEAKEKGESNDEVLQPHSQGLSS